MSPDVGRKVGRHTSRRRVEGGTEPGKCMLLGLLAAAPVVALFVLGPLLHRDAIPITVMPVWRALFLFATPALAAAALVVYYRAPAAARHHNAARFGRAIAAASAGLWILYGGLYALFLRGA